MTRDIPHHWTEGMGGSLSPDDERKGHQSQHWSSQGHNAKVEKDMRVVC